MGNPPGDEWGRRGFYQGANRRGEWRRGWGKWGHKEHERGRTKWGSRVWVIQERRGGSIFGQHGAGDGEWGMDG